MLKSIDPSINNDNESQNNYSLILNNQKTRNLLALKLSLTYSAIKLRQELGDDVIQLLEVELKRKK
jgi:hypothetical protein